MKKGLFITLEGGEGCGKTTQVELLHASFIRSGKIARAVRSPGGTDIAEKLRNLIKNPDSDETFTPEAELMLFGACHAQMSENILRPCLEDGITIVSDRFVDSTTVYQGYVRHLNLKMVNAVNAFCCKGLEPDLTILLDLPPEIAVERAAGRGASEQDRFDSESLSFHRKIREGFLEFAKQNPQRVKIVNAALSIPEVSAQIREVVNHEFGLDLL